MAAEEPMSNSRRNLQLTPSRCVSRRRLLAAGSVAAAVTAAAFAGCGGKSRTSQSPGKATQGSRETPRTGGVMNFYQSANLGTFDPQATLSTTTQQPMGGVYSRLFRFKVGPDPKISEGSELDADLATSAESPDAVTWTVKLRPDARFHNLAPVNGRAVEAEDIKASFERALNPKLPTRASFAMLDAGNVQAPDKQTVVFKLNYPYGAFNKILASPLYSWILPREATAGSYDPAKQAIGSGPFLVDSFTPDVAIVYKRNPTWYESGHPYVDGVRLAIMPDESQQQAQFNGGNLDQLGSVGSGSIRVGYLDTLRRSNPKAQNFTASPTEMYLLVGQLDDPSSPWADIRVRRAFSMALDRDAIGASVFGGKYEKQALMPLSYGKWVLKPEDLDANLAQVYKYDPAQAKSLLTAAGATNLSFKLIYTNLYGAQYKTLAETTSNMLNAIGVKTSLVLADYNSEYVNGGKGYRSGNFGKDTLVFAPMAGGYTDIDEFIFSFYDSQSARRETHLKDPQFDSMLDKARTVVSADERLKAYRDIQRYLIDKAYYLTGYPGQSIFTMVQPRVRNYNFCNTWGYLTESYAQLWLNA
jgi:peptide/nickel transport system substrate-binding protein